MASPLPIVEDVCKQMVINTIVSGSLNLSTGSVYTGIDNEKKTLPEVICWAESAKPMYKELNWWEVKTHVIVAHNAARAERADATYTAETIFDAFCDVSASVALTNLTSSFTCAELYDKEFSTTFEQDAWVQMCSFTMLACPH